HSVPNCEESELACALRWKPKANVLGFDRVASSVAGERIVDASEDFAGIGFISSDPVYRHPVSYEILQHVIRLPGPGIPTLERVAAQEVVRNVRSVEVVAVPLVGIELGLQVTGWQVAKPRACSQCSPVNNWSRWKRSAL